MHSGTDPWNKTTGCILSGLTLINGSQIGGSQEFNERALARAFFAAWMDTWILGETTTMTFEIENPDENTVENEPPFPRFTLPEAEEARQDRTKTHQDLHQLGESETRGWEAEHALPPW